MPLVYGIVTIGEHDFHAADLGYPKFANNRFNTKLNVFNNITIVSAIPWDACSKIDTDIGANLTNFALLVNTGNCFIETKLANCQNAGAIAIILLNSDGTGSGAFINSLERVHLNIYGIEIAFKESKIILDLIAKNTLLNNPTLLNGISDENLWLTYGSHYSWFIVSFTISIANIILVIFGFRRIAQFWKSQKPAKVAYICYTIIAIGACIRIIAQFDYYGTMGICSFSFRSALVSLSFPFAIASIYVIGFYWLETFRKKGLTPNIVKLNKYYKIPFFIILLVLFGTEITTATMRSVLVERSVMSILSVGMYFLMDIMTAIFFGYSCYILYKFQKSSNLNSRTLNHLFKTGRILVAFICFLIVFTGVYFIPSFRSPMPGILNSPVAHLIITIFCWIQACMFMSPQKISSSEESSNERIKETNSRAFNIEFNTRGSITPA